MLKNRRRPCTGDVCSARRVSTGPELDLLLNGWRSVLWRLTWWLRWYVRSFPLVHGRGVILRTLVTPMLPRQGLFRVAMPSGYDLEIGYRERIGISFAVYGSFERHEREALIGQVRTGTTAVDVGANVGIYALELSKAVGDQGSVIAIEPWPDNVRRLRQTIARNAISNIRVLPCAVGSKPSVVEMYGGRDPAYVTSVPTNGRSTYPVVQRVTQSTLDELWADAGMPTVSVVKIDVEGAELEVLKGARRVLASCHPTLLCEANSKEKLRLLTDYLVGLGYGVKQPPGFERWNFLFVFMEPTTADAIES